MRIVYALTDPRDGTIRYVGVSVDVSARINVHRTGYGGKKGTSAKIAWVKELQSLGLEPEYLELEKCGGPDEAFEAEKRWIDFCLTEEEPLLNPDVNRPIRRNAGRKHTDVEVDAIVAEYLQTGKRPTCWTRQNLSYVLRKRGLRR